MKHSALVPQFAKRLTALAVFFAIFFALLSTFDFKLSPTNVYAASCDFSQAQSDSELVNGFNKCMVEKKTFDDKAFSWNAISGIVCALNNQIVGKCTLYPDEVNNITASRGALAYTSRMVTALYANPPASGVNYFAHTFQKLNPVQPVYAQSTGVGYDALQPVQKLWTVFRNLAYTGFIVIFVVIGFMVMFRAHISAQAVATVQDSIPRLVIALILVTFSYAIAGLMLDIMFVTLNIIINLLGQAGVINATDAQGQIFNHSIFHIIIASWDDLVGKTASALNSILQDTIGLGVLGKLFSWALSGIGGLIVGIAALFIMFRIFVMLLMAYVMIILMTLVAPFYFLIQALPGNNGAKEWFKQMASHVSVFPTVSLMIILAGAIAGISSLGGGTGAGELQGVGTKAAQFPLFIGSIDANAVGKIIGLGILFMTPSAAELVKGSLGVKGGPNIGAGFGAIAAAGGTVGGAISQPFKPISSSLGYRYGSNAAERIGRYVPFGLGKATGGPSEEARAIENQKKG